MALSSAQHLRRGERASEPAQIKHACTRQWSGGRWRSFASDERDQFLPQEPEAQVGRTKVWNSSRASKHQRRARAEWGLRIREIHLHQHGHSDNVGKNLFLLGPPRRWDEALPCEERSGDRREGDLRGAAGNVRAKPRTRSEPHSKDSIEGLGTSSEILVKFCCRRFRGSRVANISNASLDGVRQGPTMRGADDTTSLRVGAPAMIHLRMGESESSSASGSVGGGQDIAANGVGGAPDIVRSSCLHPESDALSEHGGAASEGNTQGVCVCVRVPPWHRSRLESLREMYTCCNKHQVISPPVAALVLETGWARASLALVAAGRRTSFIGCGLRVRSPSTRRRDFALSETLFHGLPEAHTHTETHTLVPRVDAVVYSVVVSKALRLRVRATLHTTSPHTHST